MIENTAPASHKDPSRTAIPLGRLRFEEGANDLLNEYRTNRRRSLNEVERRIEKHLAPFFGGRRMANLTTAHVREYVVKRQAETEVTLKAYDVTRKDGTSRRVPDAAEPARVRRTPRSTENSSPAGESRPRF